MNEAGVTYLDVAVFAAEMAVYVVVGVAGWRLVHPVAGVAGVVAMAVWWATLHAPKAPIDIWGPLDVALRGLWFLIGVGLLVVVLYCRAQG